MASLVHRQNCSYNEWPMDQMNIVVIKKPWGYIYNLIVTKSMIALGKYVLIHYVILYTEYLLSYTKAFKELQFYLGFYEVERKIVSTALRPAAALYSSHITVIAWNLLFH